MTRPKPPKPEPTPDNGYDLYVVPRSKTQPALTALFERLMALGWRYDPVTVTWWTPIDRPEQFGRLEYDPDLLRAWVVPPSVGMHRQPYLLVLVRTAAWMPVGGTCLSPSVESVRLDGA